MQSNETTTFSKGVKLNDGPVIPVLRAGAGEIGMTLASNDTGNRLIIFSELSVPYDLKSARIHTFAVEFSEPEDLSVLINNLLLLQLDLSKESNIAIEKTEE